MNIDSTSRIWQWVNGMFCGTVGNHFLTVRECPNARPTDDYRWEFLVDGRPQRRTKTAKDAMRGAIDTLNNPVAMERIADETFKGYTSRPWGRFIVQSR